MRLRDLATHRTAACTAGVVDDADGLHALPATARPCSTWSAPGCPPRSRPAPARARRAPAVPLDVGPAAAAAAAADRARLRRLRGARRGRASQASTAAAAWCPEWYEAPTFYFTNPYALIGAHDDVPVPPGSQLLDFELEVAVVVGRGRRLADPGAGPRAHLRLHDPQRLVGPRPAAPGDEGQPRPGQGQGLRHHPRAVAGHRRRARALPRRRRASSPWTCGCRSTASRSARTCCPTWAGRSRSWSPTPPAAPGSAPATCSAPAPAATAAASPSCGAAAATQDPPPLRPGDVVEMTVEGIGTIRNRVVAGPRPAAGAPPPGRGRGARKRRSEPDGSRARSSSSPAPARAGRRRGAAARRRGRDRDRARPDAGAGRGPARRRVPAARRHRRRRLGRAGRRPATGTAGSTAWSPTPGITWRARLGRRSTRPTWPGCHAVNVTGRCSASRRSPR